MSAPTLTSSATSDYTDNVNTDEVTGTLTWNSGDRILVVAMTEDQGFTLNTPTATGLTFSALGSAITTSNSCWIHAWQATAGSSGSGAVTATRATGTGVAMRGVAAFAYGNCTGFTRTNGAAVNSTQTVSVTRGGANSAVVFWAGDWSATSVSGVGWTPAGQTQLIAQTNAGASALVAHWGDQSATGTTSYGSTGLAGTAYSKAAVEVLGSAGASPAATEATAAGAVQTATAAVGISPAEAAGSGTAYGATVSTSGSSSATEATAAGAAYNPTADTGGGGVASLFTSQTPTGDFSDGSPGITTGITVRFAVDGVVTGVRFYTGAAVSGTYIGNLWSVDSSDPGTGTVLATKTLGTTPTTGGWNSITFDTPVSVTAGVAYRAGVFSDAGRYVTTPSVFGSDLVNGNITADASGDTVGGFSIFQGVYRIDSSIGYPNSTGGGTNYFVDVLFSTVTATTATATEATGTGTAYGPAAAEAPVPAEATATGTAYNPSAATTSSTTVSAVLATAAGTAEWDAGSSISIDLVADNPIDSAGTAYNVTAAIGTSTTASAVLATAAGVANGATPGLGVPATEATAAGVADNATVATATATTATAGLATAAGTAEWDTSAAIIIVLVVGSQIDGGGTAYNATVSTVAATTVTPAEAAGTGTADNPTALTPSNVTAVATEATGDGSAYGPAPAFEVTAGTASADGAADNVLAGFGALAGSAEAITAAYNATTLSVGDWFPTPDEAGGFGQAFNPAVLVADNVPVPGGNVLTSQLGTITATWPGTGIRRYG